MKTNISEELPARKFSPAAAASAPEDDKKGGDKEKGSSPEKRIRQAVYDIRYRARREELPIRQAYSQYMQNSSMSQEERMAVRQKLLGKEGGGIKAEQFQIEDFASDTVAKALFKVFIEREEKNEPIVLTYVEELGALEQRKYKVRVVDKNSGRSYVRYATREKINKLRANPNIQSVEMLDEYGSPEPYEGERKKGSQTAKVAAGKGLDPVGREDSDVNNDGKVDKTDDYLLNRRKKVGQSIATRKEEFVFEAGSEEDLNPDSNEKKIDVMKKGKKNNCKVYDGKGGNNMMGQGLMNHQELSGEVIVETGYSRFLRKVHSLQEKAVSQNQQQLAAMAIEYLDGNMPDASDAVKQMAKMGREELKKFASTKHKGLPEKVKEEKDCGCEDGEKKKETQMDPREIPTKVNLIKNKLRAMGLKMSYEPEGEKIDEVAPLAVGAGMAAAAVAPYLLKKFAKPAVDKAIDKPATGSGGLIDKMKQRRDAINQSYEPEGEVIDERTRFAREKNVSATTGRPSVEGGSPQIKKRREKEPFLFPGSKQEPKERGKKPPVAGEPGSGKKSPKDIVDIRRASERRAKDQPIGSRFD
jgi:hypothetical protein